MTTSHTHDNSAIDALNGSFPYGAVYYRKSHPPESDWERDYAVAAEDGHNIFRHWFMWGAIEVGPDVYTWADYDRQLDLAAENGISTIVAEQLRSAPEWAFRRYAHARYVRRDGSVITSGMGGSSATGGWPGLCLDNDDVHGLAENFLRVLARRYRSHPGLGGYDVWNECNYETDICFCPATLEKFRQWLATRYDSPADVGRAWRRYGITEWADIEPPRSVAGAYPDQLDWLAFRLDRAYELMRWRCDVIRSEDPDCLITAHGIAGGLTRMASNGADDWRAAEQVQVYGLTWGSARHGDEPWKQLHAVDLVRAASRGKPFWHAESYAGPLWMQPQVIGHSRSEGRIAKPEDVRYWNLVSMAAGARGILYLRWRPLVDGPLFGAFGGYTMAGERTDRSEVMSEVARWANADDQLDLWRSQPIRGDIGIIYAPESQLFSYAQQGSTALYAQALQGAYQGFFAHNIQADWVHIDDIDAYSLLYLPFPVMLANATRERLTDWVRKGGVLVSEGCPGYFTDGGRVDVANSKWLTDLFGAVEEYVEFTPDLLEDLTAEVDGSTIAGSTFLQAYSPLSGTPVGWYPDGRVAAVDHHLGLGRTRLVGTFPGAGFAARGGAHQAFFRSLTTWAGREQHVARSDPRTTARLHDGAGGRSLWVLNPSREAVRTRITLGGHIHPVTSASRLWGGGVDQISERVLEISVGPRDATVLRLDQ